MREFLNKNSTLVAIACCVVIVATVLYAMSSKGNAGQTMVTQDYYTDDDGQTYFVDAAEKDVPFDHNGKQAVLAFVYKVDGKASVHYMMRRAKAGTNNKGGSESDSDGPAGTRREFKRPGEKAWQANPPGPLNGNGNGQPEWITP